MDFESAIWSAAKYCFLGIIIRGCYFHWAQAVFRKIQVYITFNQIIVKKFTNFVFSLGKWTARVLLRKKEVYSFCRKLMALPLVPSDFVQPLFLSLQGEAFNDQLKVLFLLHY